VDHEPALVEEAAPSRLQPRIDLAEAELSEHVVGQDEHR
jgi:hypothetical protein